MKENNKACEIEQGVENWGKQSNILK